MSLIVKIGKRGKRIVKKIIAPAEKHSLSYTRRIERVKTGRRICAMTFDDGPMDIPAAPDRFGGKSLTDVLLDTLAEFGAKGTFDVVGDTSENYPDKAGKVGSAAWGGVKYDHYPDINQDSKGGAVHNDRLIRRMLDEGHQITSHGYRHIIFGKKPFVYGARVYLGSMDKAVEDLQKLDSLMKDRYGCALAMHRPPHYVDRMQDGFTSYDVCDRMGYQYLAASFDGAGWRPSRRRWTPWWSPCGRPWRRIRRFSAGRLSSRRMATTWARGRQWPSACRSSWSCSDPTAIRWSRWTP